MRMTLGHHDGFALVHQEFFAVNGDPALTLQAGDECVAAGGVRADLLVFVKEKSVTLTAPFCASVLLTTCPSA